MKIKELLTPETWIKGSLAWDQYDKYADPEDAKACKFCLSGAMIHCYGRLGPEADRVRKLISEEINYFPIAHWNDNRIRKFEDVKNLIEKLDI